MAGFSMGGYIAQTVALRHPQLVERLVLVCTATGGPGHVETPPSTIALWEANATKTPAEFARASMPLSFAPGWADEHPDEFGQLLSDRLEHPTPPECWRAQYDACWRFVEQVTPVEEIAAPTLVVHGDADRIVPVENGRLLAGRIPNARLVEFPERGHLIQLEDRDAFNRAVLDFLTAVDAARWRRRRPDSLAKSGILPAGR